MKNSDGTRIEEVAAMTVARAAIFPVPLVISYGDHPDRPYAPVSILMTRIPGKDMGQVYEALDEHDQERVFYELKQILTIIRSWSLPPVKAPICSVLGTAIRRKRACASSQSWAL